MSEAKKRKPYKPKTLSGAAQRVRELQRIIADMDHALKMANRREYMLAKLAAKEAMFFSPLEASAAEKLRDQILAHPPR